MKITQFKSVNWYRYIKQMDNKQRNRVPSPRELFIFAQWLWSALSQPCLFSNTVGGGPGGRSLNAKNRKASTESDAVPPWGGALVSHMSPLGWGAPLTAAENQGSKSRQVDISGQDYKLSKTGSEGWDTDRHPCCVCKCSVVCMCGPSIQYIINTYFCSEIPFFNPSFVTQTAEHRHSWRFSGFGK